MADTVKNGWVVRVLGVALAEGGVDLKQAAEAWRAASEAVDGQIAALQAALRQDGDEDGGAHVVGNHWVLNRVGFEKTSTFEAAILS